MTIPIAAIETSYAGCRFRSRLEARWAVFFDSLGIEWLYEPQGYTLGPDAKPYLPDFWLTELKLWVEVKGVLTQADLETLIWASSAAGLPATGPSNPGRCTPDEVWPWRGRLLLLGDVPAPEDDGSHVHTRLDSVGDLVAAQPIAFRHLMDGRYGTMPVFDKHALNGYVSGETAEPGDLSTLNHGTPVKFLRANRKVTEAYQAARRSRFEHGEFGAA
jgi:hypothetical protein